ncbi:DUF4268 domain-containing protein [Aquimarina brevivitae]|uniref:Uncharacterized protein DUF4268 n=1 Tax=Aquimarina brevivitae TaxID=323412 RepID=A0A4Q7NTK7_9FLAO|nr:DUF4268 domain-containing protein [Aquimarina brevivitae]RZS90425.1 uncharacterized protein DUF4268 [Aquimarina brevivitae]
MYSRDEAKKIRQKFWTTFGKKYPQKWLLYNTKIKDVSLKFSFDTKKAQVSFDIEPQDEFMRSYYYDKILSLQNIIVSSYFEHAIFNEHYELPNGKIISRFYVELNQVSIHNQNSWELAMSFLAKEMTVMEEFFFEFKDFIKN